MGKKLINTVLGEGMNNMSNKNSLPQLFKQGLLKTLLTSALLLSSLLGLSVASFAAAIPTLKDVSFSSLPSGRFEVRMMFDAEPPEPVGYEINKPARIVFDFADVRNGLSTKKFALPFTNAQSAVVLGGEDRTRLILNMTALEIYTTRTDGNNFYIEVGSAAVADVMTKTLNLGDQLTSDINEFETAITSVDFRRGEKGEGKVLISLSDPSVNINVEQLAGEIRLHFYDTQLPGNLRRRLDVTDFATPVTSVSSSFDGSSAVISIKPTGDYDYLAYQTDDLYVVSIKHLTAQELEERKSKFNYVGEKLSLNFQDIAVRSVLQIIADFTELNLVASDTVEGTITLRLDNVPWDQALDLVLKTKGLDKRQIGNVLMVAPAAEIAEQERQQLETKKQLQELAPLRTEHIRIIYAKATDLQELFIDGDDSNSILSPRGSAIVDERTNSIILTETEEKIQEFRTLVKRLDIPVQQVSIEARIVEATTDFSKSLGVRWGFAGNNSDQDLYGAGGTTGLLEQQNFDAEIARGKDPASPIYLDESDKSADALVTDLGAIGSGVDPARFTLGVITGGFLITAELSAIQSQGKAELVSQPKIVTQDKQAAMIKSVEEIPYASATSAGATQISWRDAGLILEVTPNITPDQRIFLDLTINKGSVSGETSTGVPIIQNTELETNILVNNGQTIVLGGLYQDFISHTVSKVPFFGDLPLVGRLFRRTSTSKNKSELLIFITPRILNDPLSRN